MANLVILGLISSVIIVSVILIIAHFLVRTDGGNFLNIIRADFWVPSLSLFQFLIWTVVVAFSYIWISSMKLFGGDYSFSTSIPSNLLVLMGISVVVPILSLGYTKSVYDPPVSSKPPEKLPPFGMMLKNNGKITLTRFQMFLWTIIGAILYLSIVVGTIVSTDVSGLILPDIDPDLIYLMGLSQTGYIGGRIAGEEKKESKKTESTDSVSGSKPAGSSEPADEEKVENIRWLMPEGVKDFLLYGHSSEIQEKLQIKIQYAEIEGFKRYYLLGDDFFYLVDRGQIRGAGKGSKIDMMKQINKLVDTIGQTEILEL